jgi:hypothetical protein
MSSISSTNTTRIPVAGKPTPHQAKGRAAAFTALVLLLPPISSTAARTLEPSPDEMALAGRFVAARFPAASATGRLAEPGTPPAGPAEPLFTPAPPFSFTYGGKASSDLLSAWAVERAARKLDEHRTSHTVTYSEPAGGLSVRCEAVAYDDFPVVEWTLWVANS